MMLVSMIFFTFFFFFYDFFFFFFYMFFFFFFFSFISGGFFDGLFISDYLSLLLIFVSFWIFVISFFSLGFSSFSFFLFWLMFFFTIVSFFSISFFYFYLSFEFVFVILFFYLYTMGKSFERIQASFYMFFYTLLFSFPFLFFIVDYMSFYSDFFFFLNYSFYSSFFWMFLFIVFMVKLPIFSFHVWLLKAHVEAPVSGSMLLAGVMLKLGGYGIVRFLPLLKDMGFFFFFFPFFFYLSMLGSVIISVICFRQMDLKMIIAYSSIVHMGVMTLGLISFNVTSLGGSFLMMVSHGFISPLMFFLMNKSYLALNSRSILILKGISLVGSLFCLLWFFSCILNLGLPPFMSFFSEILIIGGLGHLTFLEWLFIFLLCLFTGLYCIYSYVFLSHGSFLYFFSCKCFFLDYLVSLLCVFYIFLYPFIFFV